MTTSQDQKYGDTINKELYKRNAELLFHNKMLLLMRQLYAITTTHYGTVDTAQSLIANIQNTLRLKLIQVFFDSSEGKNPFGLVFGASAPVKIVGALGSYISTNSKIYQTVFKERQPLVLEEANLLLNTEYGFTSNEEVKQLVKNASATAYPIIAKTKGAGVLLVVFSKKYAELTKYEIETVENFASLLSLAIDRSIIYEELKEANGQLAKANVRLQDLDRQKSEFLSIASHQLRTPLSILKGYIELIADGAYGKPSPKLKQVMKDMSDSNERLVGLVDEFLDITRIEQGRTKFNFKDEDLGALANSVVRELKDRAIMKKLKVSYQKSKSKVPQVSMDSDKVRQVIFNFIDNAIKYSEKGKITVTVVSEKEGVVVRVKDMGLGFDKADDGNFFQKFYRGVNVKGVNVTGTGLGIYVCRQFIEAHQGRVWAKSEGMGTGSEFGFWIPLHHVSAESAPVADKDAENIVAVPTVASVSLPSTSSVS